jgi:hypothetical protein
MEKIRNLSELELAIQALALKKQNEWQELKIEFNNSLEQFNPINMIKAEFREFVSSPTLKHDLINAGIGIATGFIAKKVLIGKTANPFAKVFGFFTEFMIAKQVTENADGIQSFGRGLVNQLFKSKNQSQEKN